MHKILLSLLLVIGSCTYSNYTLRTIRPSELIDQAALVSNLKQVHYMAFSSVYKDHWTSDLELFYLKWIDTYIKDFVESSDSNKYFLAAIYKEDLVVAWALFDTEPEINRSELISIGVNPCHWRKGLGKQLVLAIKTCRPNIESISVFTRKTNYLTPSFYEGLGFKPTSTKSAKYQIEMQGYELIFS